MADMEQEEIGDTHDIKGPQDPQIDDDNDD